MAADGGHADSGVAVAPEAPPELTPEHVKHGTIAELEKHPYRFDFFQAVSVLERLRPHATPVGEGVHPQHEAVRFSADPGLEFPASDVAAITAPAGDDEPWEMKVPFIALAGVQGPLPRALTERMLASKKTTGPMRAFLDIFHHRLASIFYRARKKRRVALDGRAPDQSVVAPMLKSIAGLGLDSLGNRLSMADRSLLRYASLLNMRPRSAAGLQALLSSYFGVRVRVEQFVGRWRTIEPEDRTRLDRRENSNVLGQSAVLGTQVWDQTGAIRLVVGPLSAQKYRDMLPTGTALQPFKDLVKLYCGPELDVEISLILALSEPARSELNAAPALGWTSWLGNAGRGRTPGATLRVNAK